MRKRIAHYRRYSIVIFIAEILAVFLVCLLLGLLVESEGEKTVPLWLVVITIAIIGFVVSYKIINKKNGANSDSLDPYILEIDAGDFNDFIQIMKKHENIRFSSLDQSFICHGVKKDKYNVHYYFVRLSECETQHREELRRAKNTIEKTAPSQMTRTEYLKYIEFVIFVIDHMTEDLEDLAKKNLAVAPKNKEYILAHNYYAIIDTSQKKLLIPSFWGDDFASERKYEFCMKRLVSILNGTETVF